MKGLVRIEFKRFVKRFAYLSFILCVLYLSFAIYQHIYFDDNAYGEIIEKYDKEYQDIRLLKAGVPEEHLRNEMPDMNKFLDNSVHYNRHFEMILKPGISEQEFHRLHTIRWLKDVYYEMFEPIDDYKMFLEPYYDDLDWGRNKEEFFKSQVNWTSRDGFVWGTAAQNLPWLSHYYFYKTGAVEVNRDMKGPISFLENIYHYGAYVLTLVIAIIFTYDNITMDLDYCSYQQLLVGNYSRGRYYFVKYISNVLKTLAAFIIPIAVMFVILLIVYGEVSFNAPTLVYKDTFSSMQSPESLMPFQHSFYGQVSIGLIDTDFGIIEGNLPVYDFFYGNFGLPMENYKFIPYWEYLVSEILLITVFVFMVTSIIQLVSTFNRDRWNSLLVSIFIFIGFSFIGTMIFNETNKYYFPFGIRHMNYSISMGNGITFIYHMLSMIVLTVAIYFVGHICFKRKKL